MAWLIFGIILYFVVAIVVDVLSGLFELAVKSIKKFNHRIDVALQTIINYIAKAIKK